MRGTATVGGASTGGARAAVAKPVRASCADAATPRLFGFADDRRARNTFLAVGVVGILAGLLSRPTGRSTFTGGPVTR